MSYFPNKSIKIRSHTFEANVMSTWVLNLIRVSTKSRKTST